MRDHSWLAQQLDFLLKTYFADIPITNPLEIRFGREAKFRFGSIKLMKGTKGFKKHLRGVRLFSPRRWRSTEPQKSIIIITSMFVHQNVPTDAVRYTIAHELCHYAHGFSSANKRLFKYPHHGGIVNRELTERGAGVLVGAFKKWLKDYRKKILAGREAL